MTSRFSPRLVRTGLVLFGASALTALGCSLIVDFDETKIPGEDTGIADVLPDTQAEVDPDTGAETTPGDADAEPETTPGDADAEPETTPGDADTGVDTGIVDTGIVDTGIVDTGIVDTGATETEPETSVDAGDDVATDVATDVAEDVATDVAEDVATDVAADVASDAAEDASADAAIDGGDADVISTFETQMTANQELPNRSTSTASGTATCTLNETTKMLSCSGTHNVTAANNAHIHEAFAGRSGGVIFPLTFTATTVTLAPTALTDAQIAALKAGRYYFNIHSPTFPGGEIRGQLLKPGETLYISHMDTAKEVPSPTLPDAGTLPTGHAGCILNAAKTTLTCEGQARNMTSTVTMAHIHDGATGVTGSPIHTFTLSGATTTSPFQADLSGVFTLASGELSKLDSDATYVNVHTSNNAPGEIRDQLHKVFTAP